MPRWNRTEFEDAVRSVAHSMLITIWHLLANETDYVDLGSDWSDRRDSEQHARRLAHQIERFDYKVTMGPVVAA